MLMRINLYHNIFIINLQSNGVSTALMPNFDSRILMYLFFFFLNMFSCGFCSIYCKKLAILIYVYFLCNTDDQIPSQLPYLLKNKFNEFLQFQLFLKLFLNHSSGLLRAKYSNHFMNFRFSMYQKIKIYLIRFLYFNRN